MRAARESGSPYLYETTAGAGLPVISTLHDLLVSGDRIVRIEAMLSGTIGYVLSNYDGSSTFASLVREAKELGYTEPDPRDDLCAADAARKALILARECGRELEFSDIAIEPLLPRSCIEAPSVEAFFAELEREEPFFRAMLERAKGANLVYAATIDDAGIRLGLRAAAQGDPLFGLRDAGERRRLHDRALLRPAPRRARPRRRRRGHRGRPLRRHRAHREVPGLVLA